MNMSVMLDLFIVSAICLPFDVSGFVSRGLQFSFDSSLPEYTPANATLNTIRQSPA